MEKWVNKILIGDAIEKLKELPDGCIQTCISSPPYYQLRNYETDGQIGLEKTPREYVDKLVCVFREVKRVLRDDGVCWIVIGDSFARNGGEQDGTDRALPHMNGKQKRMLKIPDGTGLKPKDLLGIPWMLAFSLRDDGWWLRSDIIWQKKNCMPESCTDRPTRSHEYVFLLSKSERYFYDHYAIREPHTEESLSRIGRGRSDDHKWSEGPGDQTLANDISKGCHPGGRNKRSVWTIALEPFPEGHFAVYPQALIAPCVLASTSERGACPSCGCPWNRIVENPDFSEQPKRETPKMERSDRTSSGQSWQDWRDENPTKTIGWEPGCDCKTDGKPPEPGPCIILDPFMGAGTTALVALKSGRNFIGIELNKEYVEIAERRIAQEAAQKRLF